MKYGMKIAKKSLFNIIARKITIFLKLTFGLQNLIRSMEKKSIRRPKQNLGAKTPEVISTGEDMAQIAKTDRKRKKAPRLKPQRLTGLSSEIRLRLISGILSKGVMRLIEKKQETNKEVENVRQDEEPRKAEE